MLCVSRDDHRNFAQAEIRVFSTASATKLVHHAPQLVHCDWVVAVEAESSSLKAPMHPFAAATLTLRHASGALEVKRFELSLPALSALQTSLIDAERALERA